MSRVTKVTVILMAVLLLCQSVLAFGIVSNGSKNIIKQVWDAQTVSQLQNGIVAIPEIAINEYIAELAAGNPQFRQIHITVGGTNRLILDVDSAKMGKVHLEGTITRFVQNKDESVMVVKLDKKQLIGRPVASWLFGHISLGVLAKLFGNPLSGYEDKYTTQIDGNQLTVNFKPFIDSSPLKDIAVQGCSLIELVSVDSVSTEEGMVYLHTSYHGSQTFLELLKKFIG